MDKDHKWDLTDATTKIAIGRLVIKLVIDGMPIPESAEERLALLEEHGIRFNGDTDDVEIHRSTPSHMHLTLPPGNTWKRVSTSSLIPRGARVTGCRASTRTSICNPRIPSIR